MANSAEYMRQWHQANKDRRRDMARARYAANPEKGRAKGRLNYHRRPDGKERRRQRMVEWGLRNPERVLLAAAKTRAKKGGIEFNLELDDIAFPATCPVLGIPLERCKNGPSNNSPSIDRIDPSKGYVKGNVWVISWQANRMKCNATPDELVTFARAILKLYG